ncbi:ABC transporter A family member 4-like [Dermacentor andersoni]|uniref:ABC transporter A family member 4-like n=1 Tax=Dermacentor andersoni TaxID=34620 RepID=UPI003B3BB02E
MGHMFESGFIIFGAILLMYVPLFVYRNASGTAFLEHVNPLLFMQVLCTCGAQTILHAMVLAQFIWEPSVAFAAAVVYWLAISIIPYAWLQNPFGLGYYLTPRAEKMATALSPCMLLHWCLRAMERFEKYEVPLSWHNINDNYTTLDNVGVGSLSGVGIFEVIVMAGIVFFLDNAAPWGYGVPKPLYFFFSIDYWTPLKKWNIRSPVPPNINPEYFEAAPKSVDAVVNIIDLCAVSCSRLVPITSKFRNSFTWSNFPAIRAGRVDNSTVHSKAEYINNLITKFTSFSTLRLPFVCIDSFF